MESQAVSSEAKQLLCRCCFLFWLLPVGWRTISCCPLRRNVLGLKRHVQTSPVDWSRILVSAPIRPLSPKPRWPAKANSYLTSAKRSARKVAARHMFRLLPTYIFQHAVVLVWAIFDRHVKFTHLGHLQCRPDIFQATLWTSSSRRFGALSLQQKRLFFQFECVRNHPRKRGFHCE